MERCVTYPTTPWASPHSQISRWPRPLAQLRRKPSPQSRSRRHGEASAHRPSLIRCSRCSRQGPATIGSCRRDEAGSTGSHGRRSRALAGGATSRGSWNRAAQGAEGVAASRRRTRLRTTAPRQSHRTARSPPQRVNRSCKPTRDMPVLPVISPSRIVRDDMNPSGRGDLGAKLRRTAWRTGDRGTQIG